MIDECCTTGISPGISFDNEVFYPDTVMRTVQFYFDNDGRSFAVNLKSAVSEAVPAFTSSVLAPVLFSVLKSYAGC